MLADGLLRDPDPQQAIAEVLGSENERAPLLSRQAAYLTFAQTFHPGLTAPWWFERSEIQGLTVHLAGFNSAWLSSSDADRGNLVLSRWLCHQLLAGAEDADLTIALLHHPWDYLHEHDQESEEEIRRRCGVILNGHLHQQKARLASDPDRDVLQLAAGASYAGSKWANAYQLLELDPIRGEARAHFRVWDGHDWIPDRNRYQKATDGVATLPLRRSPKAPKQLSPNAKTPAELALSRLFNEEFTTPAINAWLTADPRRALARSALKRANEDQQDPFDLLAVTLTQLGLVDEALFTSLMAERPQSADAVAEAARTSGVPLPPIARSLAAQAKSVDKRSRYSRLELVVELEELQKRRARSQRDKHDHRKLDQEIDDVVRRLAKAPSPRRGAVVAGATLEEEVARGAFGTVWRGRAPDGQTVAVKVFRPEQLKAHMAAWGFRRGVRAMRLFEQRKGPASLVRVLSVSEDELAFTMPFIDGATLEATDLTGWTLAQRLDCFQAIGEAIQFSHDERVIHRDLKPANIMIDRAGAPVVIDFDAADVGHATLLSMAINVGTLGYMAPEQSSAPRASVLMDVYSLGRVLHYLLLGRHSAMSVAHEPVVRSELAAAPPALVELVLRACNLSPEARPASVAKLLRELSVARAASIGVAVDAQEVVERSVGVRSRGSTSEALLLPPPSEVAPLEAPNINMATDPRGAPDATVNAIWNDAVLRLPPPQPRRKLEEPPPLVSGPTAEGPPPQPPLQEAPRSSAPVIEIIANPMAPRPNPVTGNSVGPEQGSPSWGWHGLGIAVVGLSAYAAWVKFGEDAPVRPCELSALGAPTGETHKPKVEGLDMPLVGLSAGQFCMGSPDGVGDVDEHPQHPVKVAGCLMGKSEVTQAQWRAVVKAAKVANDADGAGLNEDPSYFKGDKLPVENVSWCDVTRFANALSRLVGRAPVYEITDGCAVRWINGGDGYRLPTEAEWEYAARGGTTTAYATGDDEAALALAGWYGALIDDGGNSGGKTHDVCTAPKQPWGLCDLHGNVWEWVFDVYDSGTYARRAAASTVDGGPSTFDGSATLAESADRGASRVLRGGSWTAGPSTRAPRTGAGSRALGHGLGRRFPPVVVPARAAIAPSTPIPYALPHQEPRLNARGLPIPHRPPAPPLRRPPRRAGPRPPAPRVGYGPRAEAPAPRAHRPRRLVPPAHPARAA
jgi:formylglycine-generating enzyme required for sulfatase activity/serine/threonine protein kinase